MTMDWNGFDSREARTTRVDTIDRESPDDAGVRPPIDLYLVRTARGAAVLFLTRRALASYTASEKDRFLRFIRRMMRSGNSLVRWVGRVSRMGHRYYQKLEDRIDPLERMVKALNYPGPLQVWHAPGHAGSIELGDFLRWQATKHLSWIVIDGFVTAVAIVLAPFTAPIPGPNVIFFYPFLRLLSHIQAFRGARRAQRDPTISFRLLEELRWVEHGVDLRDSQEFPDAGTEPVEGLSEFLKRMG